MSFFVYILASRRNGTLYVGMTDDLARRYLQHRNDEFPGFTKQHGVKLLVWFEEHGSRESAFTRERQIKKGHRKWKLELIESPNPQWDDLGFERVEAPAYQPQQIMFLGDRSTAGALGRQHGISDAGSRASSI